MTHLLAISVGPVQEFIAAARRTRDLWFGSHLLSEISRAAAAEIKNQGGTLIFPASESAANVANVIFAEIPEGDPRAIAQSAKQAAQNRWREFARNARETADDAVVDERWNDQVNDVIEFHAAWTPTNGDYSKDREYVMRLLAGRKSFRDFEQASHDDAGLPKSSLDGQRPTVFKQPSKSSETQRKSWRKQLHLSDGEQLDVVGVVKRLGQEEGQGVPRYPSVTRVAADPWLRGVKKHKPDEFEALNQACETLVQKGAVSKVDEGVDKDFSYESAVVYKNRHSDLIEERDLEKGAFDQVAAVLKRLGGEPNPYLAVLVADGDRMGEAISKLTSLKEHQEFSKALAGFADHAKAIVDAHHGVLIYAGGDDVLAFLPVDKCLCCARELHDRFAEIPHNDGPLTLSVGLAIGHFMENLEDLREYGRAAEKHAKKPDRDGLAVHLHKRGGTPIKVRAKWTSKLDERLFRDAELIVAEAIPGKLPYELQKLADVYKDWPSETVKNAIQQDVIRVIQGKQPRSGRGHMPEIKKEIVSRVIDEPSLRRFAEQLLVSKQIAEALRQSDESIKGHVEASS